MIHHKPINCTVDRFTRSHGNIKRWNTLNTTGIASISKLTDTAVSSRFTGGPTTGYLPTGGCCLTTCCLTTYCLLTGGCCLTTCCLPTGGCCLTTCGSSINSSY